ALISDRQRQLLVSGNFNAGFVGVTSDDSSMRFLEWWKNRLSLNCRMEMEKGSFHDQKWLNHAPIYFDGVKVSRHAGLNVGHWRLHEQTIVKKNNKYIAGSHPLVLFHFSGFPVEH